MGEYLKRFQSAADYTAHINNAETSPLNVSICDDNNEMHYMGQGNSSKIAPSIDSNIVPGNIKKDVTILGVTGTYEGEGGGGFRCTNKIAASNASTSYNHQYTFEGTLINCAIGIITQAGDSDGSILEIPENASSVNYDYKTITPGTLVTDILTEQNGYWAVPGNVLLLSKEIYFTGPYDLDSEVTITNAGLLTFTNHVSYSSDSKVLIIVVFKGTDNVIDFDIVNLFLESD